MIARQLDERIADAGSGTLQLPMQGRQRLTTMSAFAVQEQHGERGRIIPAPASTASASFPSADRFGLGVAASRRASRRSWSSIPRGVFGLSRKVAVDVDLDLENPREVAHGLALRLHFGCGGASRASPQGSIPPRRQ